jgi:Skp family chaperone for outer membrane proteins
MERNKFREQENEFKRRIGNLEKLSKEKDAKLSKLQKSLMEVKRDILG